MERTRTTDQDAIPELQTGFAAALFVKKNLIIFPSAYPAHPQAWIRENLSGAGIW